MQEIINKIEEKFDGLTLNQTIKDYLDLLDDELELPYLSKMLLSLTEDMWQSNYNADRAFLSWVDKEKEDNFNDTFIMFSCMEDYPHYRFGFWKKDGIKNIEELPIVAIDYEGNFLVFSNNFNDFLKILYFSIEFDIDDISMILNLDERLELDSETVLTWEWLEQRGVLGDSKTFDLKSVYSLHEDALKKHQKSFKKHMLSFAKNHTINETEFQIDFLTRLYEDSAYYYYEYTGCVKLKIDNIKEIKEGYISHDTSDFILVYDSRSKNKTYQIEDEYVEIRKSTIILPERFGIDYNKKSIPLVISTHTLLNRFQGIADLSNYWCTMDYIRPTDIFENQQICMETYENEKQHFIDDPYLALYWLVYFGLHFDSKYNEVRDIVLNNNLQEKLIYLNEPLEFFEKIVDVASFIDIFSSYEEKKFLEKLSKDMWLTYLYNYRGGEESYNQWFFTLQLYNKVDANLIKKIRWVKNNCLKFNTWVRVKKDYESISNIPLASYIQACNPLLSRKEKAQYINYLMDELIEYQNIFISEISMSFVQIMLYDIRNDVIAEAKEKYAKIVENYYKNEKLSDEYLAIANDVFKTDKNDLVKMKENLELVKKIDSNMKINKIYKEVKLILSNFDDRTIIELINSSTHLEQPILQAFFRYLFEHNIENKKEVMTNLFFNSCYSEECLFLLFANNKLPIFEDENDANIEIVLSWIIMTDEEFNNRGISEYRSTDFIEMGFFFFAFSFNKPFIFKHIEKFILEGLSKKAEKVLYETFLDYYSLSFDEVDEDGNIGYDIYPSQILTKEQHSELIDILIIKGKKEYEEEKAKEGEKFWFIHSSAHSALSGLVTKNNKLYINQLLFENKLEGFLLPDRLMENCKEELSYLYEKIIFEENGDFTLILPTVGNFEYPDDFLKYIKNEDIYNEKNTFFFWTSKYIDWQYATYLNILKILKDVLGEKYLQVVPIASHGNEYKISDIFIFDASVATKEYPVLQIKQNELMKWELINTYDSFACLPICVR